MHFHNYLSFCGYVKGTWYFGFFSVFISLCLYVLYIHRYGHYNDFWIVPSYKSLYLLYLCTILYPCMQEVGRLGPRKTGLTTPFVPASALTEDRSKSVCLFGYNLVCLVVF